MAKFREQYQRRFQRKEVVPEIYSYDTAVCISLEGVTRNVAEEIGNELVNMYICKSYAVEWNGHNDLWLYDFDFALIPMTEFSRIIASLLEMFDYEAKDILF